MRGGGARAAAATLVAGGVLLIVSVAGAAEDVTVEARTEGAAQKFVGPDGTSTVTIETGDTVTWSFVSPSHNVVSTNASATDPRWEGFKHPEGDDPYEVAPVGTTGEFTFYKAGTYEYVCTLHEYQGMTGTVVVEGEDLPLPGDETPTPTPSATATPTPTPTPTATPTPPDDHTNTPAPSPGADDTTPALTRLNVRGIRRGARVRFTLSEPATVTMEFRKRGRRRVKDVERLHAPVGTSRVRVRSRKLRRGRYRLTLVARDAMGNRSDTERTRLRIGR